MKRTVIICVAAVLALAACTPPVPSSSGSPGPVPAVTVTATVTTTVTPSPVAAPPVPDFDFTHFEGAQIGGTWGQMGTQMGVAVAGYQDCPWYGPLWETERVSTRAFTDARNPNGPSTFFITTRNLLSTAGPYPRNAEGVGVGSTKAAVLAAYPSAVVSSWSDMAAGDLTLITVPDPASSSKYIFATSNGETTVDMLMWGTSSNMGGQWGHFCSGL